MNDTELQSSPITLDRRLVLGEIDYQVTAFPTDDHRIDLCIVSSDRDGQMVSEISGGIAPSDLTALTDVLTSTLAGLIAMTRSPMSTSRLPAATRDRPPNQGIRWAPADDARLIDRYRAGARLRDLTGEFGRSSGGVRARLEFLGVLAPGAPWRVPGDPSTPDPAAPDSSAPDSSAPDPSAPDPSAPDPSAPDPSDPEADEPTPTY